MHALLPALLILATATGCVRRYSEPAPNEPHALVRIRVVHHTVGGPQLEETVRLNGYAIDMPPVPATAPATWAVRVRPEATTWRFGTTFFHIQHRQVLRTHTRQVPCGTTTGGYGRSTYTQTRYCSQTEQRWETVAERIVDAACDASSMHLPQVGGAYILQYDYYGHGQCTAQCLRQIPAPDGVSFRLMPCGASEPPGIVGPMPPLPALTSGGEAPPLPRSAPPPSWPAAPPPAAPPQGDVDAFDELIEPSPPAESPAESLGTP